jgi:hypothetical protein
MTASCVDACCATASHWPIDAMNCGKLVHFSAKKRWSPGTVVSLTGLLCVRMTINSRQKKRDSSVNRTSSYRWRVQWRWRHAHSTHWRLWRCVSTRPLYRRRALRPFSRSLLRTVWLLILCLLRSGVILAVCEAARKRFPRYWSLIKRSCCGVVTLGARGFCLSGMGFVARKRWLTEWKCLYEA